MKYARIRELPTGYWAAIDDVTNAQIGQACFDELAAYKMANNYGYIVKGF